MGWLDSPDRKRRRKERETREARQFRKRFMANPPKEFARCFWLMVFAWPRVGVWPNTDLDESNHWFRIAQRRLFWGLMLALMGYVFFYRSWTGDHTPRFDFIGPPIVDAFSTCCLYYFALLGMVTAYQWSDTYAEMHPEEE